MLAKKHNGFDSLAPVYDRLAALVFGKAIRKAQLCFLNDIPKGGNVLILGGGTGWLLAELLNVNPDCKVWYVEASRKMLESAQSKVASKPTASVHYIHGTEEFLPLNIRFNAVITNFYLDLFSAYSIHRVLNIIIKSILPDGILLVSDFTKGNVWSHRVLLFIMYRFFRLVCRIEATHLPDWRNQLRKLGWEEAGSKLFYNSFIQSSLYTTPAGKVREAIPHHEDVR